MRAKRSVSVLTALVLAIGLASIPSASEASSGCAPGQPSLGAVNTGTLESNEIEWYDVSSSEYQHLRMALASSHPFHAVHVTVYAWDGATECTKVDSTTFNFYGVNFPGVDVPAGQHLVSLENWGTADQSKSTPYGLTLTPVSTALPFPV